MIAPVEISRWMATDSVPLIPMISDPRFLLCLRYVGLRRLLETKGRPRRIEVEIDDLLMEARQIYDHGIS
jgi:hypothetical protein